MAKRTDLTALMERKKLTPEPVVATELVKRRTLNFSEADERELDRIEAYLRERGYGRIATAKLVRIALRVAFRGEMGDADVKEVYEEVLAADARRKG